MSRSDVPKDTIEDAIKDRDQTHIIACKPSDVLLLNDSKASGISAIFEPTDASEPIQILFSFVSKKNETSGTVKVVRTDATAKLIKSFSGAVVENKKIYVARYHTSLFSTGNEIGLAYHSSIPEDDPQTSSTSNAAAFFQVLSNELVAKSAPSIANDITTGNSGGIGKYIDAYLPRIRGKNDQFVVYWTDFRLNDPKRNGQNFILEGAYYSTYDLSGKQLQFDKQFVQGSRATSKLQFDKNLERGFWMSSSRDEQLVKSSTFPDSKVESLPFTQSTSDFPIAVNENFLVWVNSRGYHFRDIKLPLSDQNYMSINEPSMDRRSIDLVDNTIVSIVGKPPTLKVWTIDSTMNPTQDLDELLDGGLEEGTITVLDLRRNEDVLQSLILKRKDDSYELHLHTSCIKK